ncbi:hypothetical protein Maes01_02111 [Microbulbifer aestuariivivens]|uniref:Uncharacterized protein n=1 Tax=Microbulbifer aestuariivivens TaxID=1908308 RepID=A0ABP9WQQ4_9GAMM
MGAGLKLQDSGLETRDWPLATPGWGFGVRSHAKGRREPPRGWRQRALGLPIAVGVPMAGENCSRDGSRGCRGRRTRRNPPAQAGPVIIVRNFIRPACEHAASIYNFLRCGRHETCGNGSSLTAACNAPGRGEAVVGSFHRERGKPQCRPSLPGTNKTEISLYQLPRGSLMDESSPITAVLCPCRYALPLQAAPIKHRLNARRCNSPSCSGCPASAGHPPPRLNSPYLPVAEGVSK